MHSKYSPCISAMRTHFLTKTSRHSDVTLWQLFWFHPFISGAEVKLITGPKVHVICYCLPVHSTKRLFTCGNQIFFFSSRVPNLFTALTNHLCTTYMKAFKTIYTSLQSSSWVYSCTHIYFLQYMSSNSRELRWHTNWSYSVQVLLYQLQLKCTRKTMPMMAHKRGNTMNIPTQVLHKK